MSELPGPEELEALRSRVADVLGTADATTRRTIIKELFTEEFANVLSPEMQQAVHAIPVSTAAQPARILEQETPEQKADRLLKNVIRAEFDSFQEYSFVSTRSGKGFVSTTNKDEIKRDSGGVYEGYGNYELTREDDIVPYPKDLLDRQIRARPSLIPISVARFIDPNLVTEDWGQFSLKGGELYCVVGRKQGRVIIQGGSKQHTDRANRPNNSSFKIVFASEEAANEYIDWLVNDPKDAYGPMLRRATGSYDEGGNFRQALIPSPEGKWHDPFSVIPKKVMVKDYRTPQPTLLQSK